MYNSSGISIALIFPEHVKSQCFVVQEKLGYYVYHSSMVITPFEALYGTLCRTPVCQNKVGEQKLIGPELVQEMTNCVNGVGLILGAKAEGNRNRDSDIKHVIVWYRVHIGYVSLLDVEVYSMTMMLSWVMSEPYHNKDNGSDCKAHTSVHIRSAHGIGLHNIEMLHTGYALHNVEMSCTQGVRTVVVCIE
ncbi:2S seed storage protein [Cucumis melo var. makuwa]|uniref:2S seed storage protein n=1 Tax=Cucumis melo var. makuwa TaxID=1194695 RepID=A0A5D3CK51_CUCMM|nr:2S seed storage protein [Cucumis melo var. makuwa]